MPEEVGCSRVRGEGLDLEHQLDQTVKDGEEEVELGHARESYSLPLEYEIYRQRRNFLTE